MGLIIRWKRMRYGTGERDTERYMGFLLVCVCAAMGEKGSSLRSSKLIKHLNQKLFELTVNKLTSMTQDEKWQARYNEVKEFIEREHRNPSKHRIEEHDMLNWLKANRKHMNSDALKEPRLSKFKELLVLVEDNKRKNQYQ